MNDAIRFKLDQLMQDVRITPVTDSVADSRFGRLTGYIDCLRDCGVISSADAVQLRNDALQAYIHGAAA